MKIFLFLVLLVFLGIFCPLKTNAQTTIFVNFSSNQSGCDPLKVSFYPILKFSDSTKRPVIRSYSWDFGDATPTSNLSNPVHYFRVQNGSYFQKFTVSLTVTTMDWYEYTCTKADWISVRKSPLPKIVASPGITTIAHPSIQFDMDTLLSTNINFRDTSIKYLWLFGKNTNPGSNSGIRNPQYIYNDTGLFHVLLQIKENGCIGIDSLNLYIGPKLLVFIPEIFKPNGSHNANKGLNYFDASMNEKFGPVISGFHSYSLDIYNRKGDLFFHSINPSFGWDGNLNGLNCPEGAYIYNIRLKDAIDKDYFYQGMVILVR